MNKTCHACNETKQAHEMVPDGTVEGTVDERPRTVDDQGRLCDSELRLEMCKRCCAASCPYPVCEGCWEIYGPLDIEVHRTALEKETIKVIKIYPAPALSGRTSDSRDISMYDYQESLGWIYYCHACAQELNIQENSIVYA